MRVSELLSVYSPALETLYRTRTCGSECPKHIDRGWDFEVAATGRLAVCTSSTQRNKRKWSQGRCFVLT